MSVAFVFKHPTYQAPVSSQALSSICAVNHSLRHFMSLTVVVAVRLFLISAQSHYNEGFTLNV